MTHRVITMQVQSERLTFNANDWPAIQRAVNDAIKKQGWQAAKGVHSMPQAIGFSVAEESRLTGEKVY